MRRLAIIETNYKHGSKGLEPYTVTETWQIVEELDVTHPVLGVPMGALFPPRWRNIVVTSYFAALAAAEAYAEAMERIMAGQGDVATMMREAPR